MKADDKIYYKDSKGDFQTKLSAYAEPFSYNIFIKSYSVYIS